MKDFHVTIRLKNNQLKRRRDELEYSLKEMAKAIGVHWRTYLDLENLHQTGYNMRLRQWTKSALKVAKYFGEDCETLFPDSIREIKKTFVCLEANGDELAPAPYQYKLGEAVQEHEYLCKERDGVIESALETLTPRQKDVIERRFGLNGKEEQTLDEVANAYGVTRERIRQVEYHGLRCMRHPSRSKQLRPYHVEI